MSCSPEICATCPFKGKPVGARGNIRAPIVIVGEGPGRDELRAGKPFVGPSGDILWKTIPEGYNIDEDIYVTNATCCFPRNKTPGTMETATKLCHERLMAELKAYPRKVILTLGNPALWSVTGNYNGKITQVRGSVIASPLASVGVIPAVHPAALMRGTGSYRQFRRDIHYAFDLLDGAPLRKPTENRYVEVQDQDLNEIVSILCGADYLAADVETTGFSHKFDRILCLGIARVPEITYVFKPEQLPKLRRLFEKETIRWIWHNGKFDVKFLWKLGLPARVDEDPMLLSYALDENPGQHDLEQIAGDMLGAPDYKWESAQYLKKKTDTFEKIPWPILCRRVGRDCSFTLQIWELLREEVRQDKHLERLYTKTLLPASACLADVEDYGILVDLERIEENGKKFGAEYDALVKELQTYIGYPINPNSPIQVAELLFDKLKFPQRRKRSTSKEVLAKLPDHPVVKLLRKIRKVGKAYSTYVKGMKKHIKADGCIYTTTLIHGTRTGRLASRKPNLQNIPRDPQLRGMFIARPGRRFIELDYNQAELRCLADLSGDDWLCELYNSTSRSLHNEMSIFLFGENYTEEQRMRAKAVNFGIPYGRQAGSIAEEFDQPVAEAQKWIDGWFERCPKAEKFINKCRNVPRVGGTMITPFGRKKRHHLVTRELLGDLQNEAANFPHQSIASDMTLHSAIAISVDKSVIKAQKLLKEFDARIIILVHDSILIEAPDNEEVCREIIKVVLDVMHRMAPAWGLRRVPFIADAKWGTRWGSLEKVKDPKPPQAIAA
jgi:DNA polymerase-1